MPRPPWIFAKAALSFGLTLSGSVARAQEHSASPTEPVEVTEVIVRGAPSTDGDLRNTALITSQDVMEQNAGSVVDAVRKQPGVSTQQTTPGQGTIYVRGFSGRAVGHTLDGVRLNTAFYRAGNNPYLALIDPYSLRRIVVEPGATSVEYGSDALGGAVLMSTPSPYFAPEGTGNAPDDEARAGTRAVKLFQSFSSNPFGLRSHAELTERFLATAINVGVTYIRDQDVRPGRGTLSPDPDSYVGLEREVGSDYQPRMQRSQEGTAYEFFGANATLRQGMGSWDVTAKAQFGYRPTLVRYDRIVPLFKQEAPARFQAASTPMSRSMVALSARHTSKARVYRWSELLVAWQGLSETNLERRWDEACLDDPASEDPDTCLTRQRLTPLPTTSKEVNRSDAGTLRYVMSLAAGDAVNVRIGLDLHADRVFSQAWQTDLLSDETTDATSRYPDGSVLGEGGLFGKTAFRVGRVSGYVGARAMGFFVTLPEQAGHAAYERTLADFSASAGLRYALAPGLAVVGNFGRGVRMPNVADFSGLGARAQGRYQVPNHEVAPEHSYTADLGIKVQRASLTLNTFLFGSRYADAIILAPTTLDGEGTSPEGDRYYRSVNAARIDYLGLDLSFHARVVRSLAVFGRYLAMLGTETNPAGSGLPVETPADRVPPHQGELGVEVPLGSSFELETWGSFRAKQDRLNDPVNLDDNRIPEGGTPGYVTLHARGTYQLLPTIEMFARIDNLTDARVLDHGSGFYGPGFSASVGISLDTEPAAQ